MPAQVLSATPSESWPVICMEEYLGTSGTAGQRMRARDGWRSPLAEGAGFRHDYDEEIASGRWEFQQLVPGLCIAMADLVANRPIPLRHRMNDQLIMSAMIEGAIPQCDGPSAEGDLVRGHCAVVGLGPGDEMRTLYERGKVLKWVDIYIERRRFAEVTGLDAADMPLPVREYLEHGGSLRCRPLMMSQAVLLAAAQVKDCPYRGSFRRTFLTAKALEIACDVLFAMSTRLCTGRELEDISLSARDHVRLDLAMRLISESLDRPLSIAGLAARCGLTRQKLQVGFRLMHGDTVGNIRDRLRMEHALRRVCDSSTPIIDIALEAGYQQATSFARAFKSVHGMSPMRMRKMARKSGLVAKVGGGAGGRATGGGS